MSMNAFTSPSLLNLNNLPTALPGASFEDIMGTQSDPMLQYYARQSFDWNSISPVAPTFGDNALTTPKPPAGPIGIDVTTKEVTPLQVKDYRVFDKPNLLNAGITAMFTGLADLAGVWSSQKLYDLYREQEQLYIENANEQARRIKIRGEIALADLRSKHAVTQGTNELSVAGAGAGGISGSFMDKLMANRKYDSRDEVAQGYETTWAVYNARRDGILKAYETAGQAYAKAIQQRNTSISRLFTGLASGVTALLKDKQAYDQTKAQIYIDQQRNQAEAEGKIRYYSNNDTGNISKNYIYNNIAEDPLSINGAYGIDPETGALVTSVERGTEVVETSSSLYKLIQKETMPGIIEGDL